jgi:integrase
VAEGQQMFFRGKFSNKWNTIRQRARLEDINFHDLRRTFGSLQADAGVPIKALQEMYNHSNIETTMEHYIATGEGEKRKGVNKLKVKEWL